MPLGRSYSKQQYRGVSDDAERIARKGRRSLPGNGMTDVGDEPWCSSWICYLDRKMRRRLRMHVHLVGRDRHLHQVVWETGTSHTIVYADLEFYRCAIASVEILRRAHADAPVVSHWASRHAQVEVEREAVIEDWSARLEALRKTASPSPTEGVGPAVCVGG